MSENTEQVIWSLPVTKGFFKQTVVQERQITNLRVIQGEAYIGLALLEDIVVMNQHRVSDSSYTSVGLTGYSPRFGMGSSKSRTVGDVVFMYKGKPFIIFSQIPDPQGVVRLAKAARKRALETIKAEEKMNNAILREEERRMQQLQQKERSRLRTKTTASSGVITCPRCTTKNTEGSKYCNNCGFRFADAAKEEEGTIINQRPLSQSSSPISSLPSPPTSTIKTIQGNAVEFVTCELRAYSVKIDYPSKWGIDEHPEPPNFIIFKSPPEDPSDALFESVGISSFNIISETPEEIMQGAIIDLERNNPDFTLIESYYTILAGRPAHAIVCDFGGKRYMSIVTIMKDIAYQITYVAEPSKYDIYLPIVQMMMDSFEIML